MDNIQLILYIVFLVGYFLFKLLTGKKKSATREDTEKYDQVPKRDFNDYDQEPEVEYDPMGGGPKSFEEILEELAGGGKKTEVIKKKAEKKAEEVKQNYEHYEQEGKDRYKKSVEDASKYTTLDERVDMDKLETKMGEVEDLDAPVGAEIADNPYLAMFSNLEDAKKAIVINEILTRKY